MGLHGEAVAASQRAGDVVQSTIDEEQAALGMVKMDQAGIPQQYHGSNWGATGDAHDGAGCKLCFLQMALLVGVPRPA